MHRFMWPLVAVVVSLAVAASVGVASATAAKGGNSENAKLCQKGGWMDVQGSDGTQFANQGECVSFGAHGGTIVPKPTCTAGSENFSDDALGSQPTAFAGGTIDGPYAEFSGVQLTTGAISGWSANQRILNAGNTVGPFRLTFTNAVRSVQLEAISDTFLAATLTLTAYDASNAIVDTDTYTQVGSNPVPVGTLSVSSTTNNIKYFTLVTTTSSGIVLTNIVWDCA
jgi:hypothetical protein